MEYTRILCTILYVGNIVQSVHNRISVMNKVVSWRGLNNSEYVMNTHTQNHAHGRACFVRNCCAMMEKKNNNVRTAISTQRQAPSLDLFFGPGSELLKFHYLFAVHDNSTHTYTFTTTTKSIKLSHGGIGGGAY